MNLTRILLLISGSCYGVAFLLHLFSFSGKFESGRSAAFFLLRLGFFVGTFHLASEAVEHDFFLPVAGISQSMAFLAWAIAFVYLVLLVRIQSESFGLVLSPILLVLISAACVTFKAESQVPARLLNPYFAVHIAGAFFAYASFTLSFAAGLLYLIQCRELKVKHTGRLYHKLPSLEELEKLIYQPILWGVPLLVAAVAIGLVWAKSVYGEFWLFDPKTLAIGLTLGLYGVILYLHYISSMRGKRVVVLSLVAFVFVLFSFVGTRFIDGSHNFLH